MWLEEIHPTIARCARDHGAPGFLLDRAWLVSGDEFVVDDGGARGVAAAEAVEEEVDDWGGVEGEDLGDDEAAYDGDA